MSCVSAANVYPAIAGVGVKAGSVRDWRREPTASIVSTCVNYRFVEFSETFAYYLPYEVLPMSFPQACLWYVPLASQAFGVCFNWIVYTCQDYEEIQKDTFTVHKPDVDANWSLVCACAGLI